MKLISKHCVDHQYSVTWWITDRGTHVVKYGAERRTFRKNEDLEACHQYGECIRHQIECGGAFT